MFEILDTHSEIRELPEGDRSARRSRATSRRSMSVLPMTARQPVLTGRVVRGNPGELVAIVGPTGAGKTTVMNLLHRFYDPTEGRITVDGIDLRQVTLESWYRQIALVPQETILFGGTILDNIRYGNRDARRAVKEASRAALCPRLHHGFSRSVSDARRRKGHQPVRRATTTDCDRPQCSRTSSLGGIGIARVHEASPAERAPPPASINDHSSCWIEATSARLDSESESRLMRPLKG